MLMQYHLCSFSEKNRLCNLMHAFLLVHCQLLDLSKRPRLGKSLAQEDNLGLVDNFAALYGLYQVFYKIFEYLHFFGMSNGHLHRRQQVLFPERLVKNCGNTDFFDSVQHIRIAIRQKQNNRNLQFLPYPTSGIQATVLGKHRINESYIGKTFTGHLHGRLAIAAFIYCVKALIPEYTFYSGPNDWVFLANKN